MAFSTVETRLPNAHFHTAANAAAHKKRAMATSSAAATAPSVPNSIRERTVVVFDWDDTLCPSTWLHAQNLLPKYRGHQIHMAESQRQILSLIAANVARLLTKAVSYGPVFVVTAAEYGWVELSCALYLPMVQEILQMSDIHIVSARSWYEQTFGIGGDSSSWKHEVMQLIARKCFGGSSAAHIQDHQQQQQLQQSIMDQDIYFNFLSIGDSMAERDACHSAVDLVPCTFAKTLKFVEHPSSEEIVQQVELTHDSFEQMCGWGASLDLRLTRSQLAELRCGGPAN